MPSSTAAKGLLRVLQSNPRYFTDGSGKAIYLAGSHTWWNFEDNGHRLLSADNQDPPPIFDYNGHLDFLVARHHNFFRLGRWEAPKWQEDQPYGCTKYSQLHPWVRSGPGLSTGCIRALLPQETVVSTSPLCFLKAGSCNSPIPRFSIPFTGPIT